MRPTPPYSPPSLTRRRAPKEAGVSPSPERWDLVFNSLPGRVPSHFLAGPPTLPLIICLRAISQLSQKPLLSPLAVCFAPGLYLELLNFVRRKMNSSFTSEWILLRQDWRRRRLLLLCFFFLEPRVSQKWSTSNSDCKQ